MSLPLILVFLTKVENGLQYNTYKVAHKCGWSIRSCFCADNENSVDIKIANILLNVSERHIF